MGSLSRRRRDEIQLYRFRTMDTPTIPPDRLFSREIREYNHHDRHQRAASQPAAPIQSTCPLTTGVGYLKLRGVAIVMYKNESDREEETSSSSSQQHKTRTPQLPALPQPDPLIPFRSGTIEIYYEFIDAEHIVKGFTRNGFVNLYPPHAVRYPVKAGMVGHWSFDHQNI